MGPLFISLLFVAFVAFVFYWAVRLAVRDAIEDADERRAKKGPKAPPRP